MAPELVGLAILTVAVTVIGLLMLADRMGWQSPLPRFEWRRQWNALLWALLALVAALQVWRLAGEW